MKKAIVYLKVEIECNAEDNEELKEMIMDGNYTELNTDVQEITDLNGWSI